MKVGAFPQRMEATLRAKSDAQTLLEFAMVLPVFLWLVIGIVDFGRCIATYAVISNAAHEGARAGIFPATTNDQTLWDGRIVDGYQSATGFNPGVNSVTFFLGAIPDSPSGVDPGTGTYVVVGASDGTNTWSPSSGTGSQPALTTQRASGNEIIVTVHYRFYPITPLLSSVVGSSINLSATSTAPIE